MSDAKNWGYREVAPAEPEWPDVSPEGLRKMAEIAAPNNGRVFLAAADQIERAEGRACRAATLSSGSRVCDCSPGTCPDRKAEQAEAPSDELKTLLNTFERQAQRFGELWERCQGKGWPEKESDEFHSLRDDRMPKTRAALLKALATQPTASNAGEREAWKPTILFGPRTHICWTPDAQPPEERVKVVLISAADYDRACAALASKPPTDQEALSWALELVEASVSQDLSDGAVGVRLDLRAMVKGEAPPLPKLPEPPYAHIYEWDTPDGVYRSLSPGHYNGVEPTRTVSVHKHPQACAHLWGLGQRIPSGGGYYAVCMMCGLPGSATINRGAA